MRPFYTRIAQNFKSRDTACVRLCVGMLACLIVGAAPSGSERGEPASISVSELTLEIVEGERASEPETFEAFSILAVNTNETLEVRMVARAPTEASLKAIARTFRCLRTEREAEMAPALVALLFELARKVQVPLELVSGYRAPYAWKMHALNYHERAQAADIRVKGVPAQTLFALARSMNIPGLGIYPASGMIHIDVREVPYHWVDYSPPTHWGRSSP
jgi:uncharacterized protein YcbK (DUF882 family)